MRVVLMSSALIVAAAVVTLMTGNARWRRDTTASLARLDETPSGRSDHTAIDQLPAPAARYLRRAIVQPSRRVRSVVAAQDAEFFINGAWRRLTATQHFTADPPGFVWDARIAMAPLVHALVRDAYVSGRGSMQASIYGLYTLVDLAGTPELNSGALQRFLGEAVWLPTVLLPSTAVAWTPHDERSSVVTLTDHGTSVSLLFVFDEHDDVIRISGDRYRETNGAYLLQPWSIQCSDHQDRAGMRVPNVCEVAWLGPNGAEPYWRGRITSIDYNFWH